MSTLRPSSRPFPRLRQVLFILCSYLLSHLLAVSLQVLESDCAQLEKFLQSAKNELHFNPNNLKLQQFVAEYDHKVATVREDLRQALSLFKQVCSQRVWQFDH